MFWDVIVEKARQQPEASAVICGNQRLTYAQIVDITFELGRRLPTVCGMAKPRAFIKQRDQLSYLLHILSCWSAGIVPVLLRSSISNSDLEFLESIYHPAARVYQPVEPADLVPHRSSDDRDFLPYRNDVEAVIICTSGTTGNPKLVALPASAVYLNAKAIAHDLQIGLGDIVAVGTPLSYMYGFMGGAVTTLSSGGCLLLGNLNAPMPEFQAGIRMERATVVQGPPSYLQLFLAYWNGKPFENVRLLTTGGESLPRDLRKQLEDAFPAARKVFLYGMTEAGPRISHTDFADGGGLDQYIGKPFEHIKWKIITEGSHSLTEGRLAIKGPSIFLGYLEPDGSYSGIDDDGYFVSSDVVELLKGGHLRFKGRGDRIFKSGGKQINPQFVEEVIEQIEGVSRAICRPRPHRLLGFVLHAQVYVSESSHLTSTEIRNFTLGALESHCVPTSIEVIQDIDLRNCSDLSNLLSESGKTNRH